MIFMGWVQFCSKLIPPLAVPTSHVDIGYKLCLYASHSTPYQPPGKAKKGRPKSLGFFMHMEDPEKVSGSYLQIGSALIMVIIWVRDQWMEDLLPPHTPPYNSDFK